MNYEYFIARRYLRSKNRSGMVSFTTLFSFLVVVIGVASITIIMSIMNGFESVVIDSFLMLDSHIRVTENESGQLNSSDEIEKLLQTNTSITGITPFVMSKVMLISERETAVATLKGIDRESINNVLDFSKAVIYGTDDFTLEDMEMTKPGIILGDGIADQLGVMLGDELRVMNSKGVAGVFSEPAMRAFQVTGFFRTDMAEFDYFYAFTSLSDAQNFFRLRGEITGFDARTADFERSESVADELKSQLDEKVAVNTWYARNKNLYSAMRLEKVGALIILSLIIVVASFSIASSLIMLVLEKRNEIGIIKSMGGTAAGVKKVFIINGMIIGLSGTTLGLVLGFLISWLQYKFELIKLPADIYIIGALPIQIQAADFILVGMIALTLTLSATIYPANKAAQMKPARVLRYE